MKTNQKGHAMKTRDLMTRDPLTCTADDTLEHAAEIMWSRDCGCVPIVDAQRRLVGMLTDRDVCMAAYTRGMPLRAMTVNNAMAHEVFSVGPDELLTEAADLMRLRQIRRLPVVDGEGRVVGLLSLSDLARAAADYRGGLHTKDLEKIGATVAEVSRPRTPPASPPIMAGPARLAAPPS